jgi:hypothetical protein
MTALLDPAAPQKPAGIPFNLLSPKEAAKLLKVSLSWLAKARMRGDPRVTEQHYNRASSMSAAQAYSALAGKLRDST